jgi:hypothetical protein
MRNEPIISTRPISAKKLKTELDTSTGISYNGTTTTVPNKADSEGNVVLRKIYLKYSEELPNDYKEAMVRNAKYVLDLLPPEEHDRALEQIEEYRRELGMS